MRQQRKKTTRGKTGYPTYSEFLKNHAWEVWDASGASCSRPSRGQQPHRQQDEAEHQHPQCCKHRRQDSWGCRALGAAPAGIARAHLSRPSGSGPAAHPTLLPAGTSGSVPVSLLLRSACPPALKVWSKDRKTWKELQELSLFSLSTVYINNFIRNRSLTSVFWFSKGNSCS